MDTVTTANIDSSCHDLERAYRHMVKVVEFVDAEPGIMRTEIMVEQTTMCTIWTTGLLALKFDFMGKRDCFPGPGLRVFKAYMIAQGLEMVYRFINHVAAANPITKNAIAECDRLEASHHTLMKRANGAERELTDAIRREAVISMDLAALLAAMTRLLEALAIRPPKLQTTPTQAKAIIHAQEIVDQLGHAIAHRIRPQCRTRAVSQAPVDGLTFDGVFSTQATLWKGDMVTLTLHFPGEAFTAMVFKSDSVTSPLAGLIGVPVTVTLTPREVANGAG